MQVQILLLLPMAFLLPPGARAGEIIGGKEAWSHSRPHMAFLHIQDENNYRRCAGFLVAEKFVLTAAHCQGDSIKVILGAHNIRQREWRQQEIPVQQQIPHPEYNSETINNDIMLLQLEKPAKLNGFVKSIPLPETGEWVEPRTVCSIAGWGRTIANDKSSAANALREVEVKVVEDEECSEYDNYNTTTMLCAGQPQKCRNSAKGDSGGPLVCDGKAQGIVSRMSIAGIPPGVYTRVSAFIGWIQDEMGQLQP